MNIFIKLLIPIFLSLFAYQHFIQQCFGLKTPKDIQLELFDQKIIHWIGTSNRHSDSSEINKYEYVVKTKIQLLSKLKTVRDKLSAMPDNATEMNFALIKQEFGAVEENFSDFWFRVLPLEFYKFEALKFAAFQLTWDSTDTHQLPDHREIIVQVKNILELEKLHRYADGPKQREQFESRLANAYEIIRAVLKSWEKIVYPITDLQFCPDGRRAKQWETTLYWSGRQAIIDAKEIRDKSFRRFTQLFPIESSAQVSEVFAAAVAYLQDHKHLKNIVCLNFV